MSDPYPLIQCCERLQKAATDENLSALRQRLEELADLLGGEYGTKPAFGEMRETARDLADQVKEAEELTAGETADPDPRIPDSLRRGATTLTRRVCERILQTADIDTESLADLVAEPATDAIESFVAERDELEAENVLWAAKARAVATQRDETMAVLEDVIEELGRLDTDRSRLEASRRRLEEMEKREQEASEQASRIDDLSRNL